MHLFLLFSIPLTFLLINSFFNNEDIRKRKILMPFLLGVVFSIPFYLIYWSFFSSIFNNWTSSSLFFHYFINRDGLASLYITIVIILVYTFGIKKISVSRLREFTAYNAGFFWTLCLYDVLTAEEWFGPLELFFIPLLRLVLLMVLSIHFNRYLQSSDWKKYMWVAGAVLAPFLTTVVPYMYSLKLFLPSVILLLTVTGGAVVIYLLECRGRLS